MTDRAKFRVTPTSVLAAAAFCFFLFAAGRAVVNGVVWLSDKLSPEQLVCAEETRDLGTVRRGERPPAGTPRRVPCASTSSWRLRA